MWLKKKCFWLTLTYNWCFKSIKVLSFFLLITFMSWDWWCKLSSGGPDKCHVAPAAPERCPPRLGTGPVELPCMHVQCEDIACRKKKKKISRLLHSLTNKSKMRERARGPSPNSVPQQSKLPATPRSPAPTYSLCFDAHPSPPSHPLPLLEVDSYTFKLGGWVFIAPCLPSFHDHLLGHGWWGEG